MIVVLALLIAAFVLFTLATIGVTVGRISLIAAGFALATLAAIVWAWP